MVHYFFFFFLPDFFPDFALLAFEDLALLDDLPLLGGADLLRFLSSSSPFGLGTYSTLWPWHRIYK